MGAGAEATQGLTVEGLTFRYGPGHEVLFDALSWKFPPGTITAVTGPSGRGKSTLLFLLGLLVRSEKGAIHWRGDRVDRLRDHARSRFRASTVGFVFQDAALDLSRSVLDNVCEAALYLDEDRRRARQRAMELLARFEVDLRADHRPGEISGGQAQRVALCRALFNDPPIVLADEPTGNLDAASADLVLDGLTAAAAGGAVVVVSTHSPEVVGRCDRRLLL